MSLLIVYLQNNRSALSNSKIFHGALLHIHGKSQLNACILQAAEPLNPFPDSMGLSVCFIHMQSNHWQPLYLAYLLNIIFSKFIQYCILFNGYIIVHGISIQCHILFICSSIDGCLGCFSLLTMTINAAMNICVQLFCVSLNVYFQFI